MELLLLFSFLIHIVTLYVLFRLHQNQKAVPAETAQKEIEGLLAAYVNEIKEENDNLIHRLGQNNGSEDVENRPEKESETESLKSKEQMETDHEDIQYSPPVSQGEDSFEQSLAARALFLEKQGCNHEEIARKLNKGKGEIELLLKFRR
jgi:hypothetical protein